MPAVSRPSRSLVALALVVNLFVASGPVSAGGVQRATASATPAAVSRAATPQRGHEAAQTRTGSAATSTIEPAVRGDWIVRARPSVPDPRPIGVAKATKATTAGSASYKGRNHVWIPALGVSRSVTFYSCSSTSYPGNRVYRWGCAGSNNVYLFGHAHSVFKPLHDAYVRGRLRKGMKLYYANGSGKVSTYAVSWWKVTTPDKGAWAYASQSAPSLTLQTCVGANSQYRLIVRLRKVG
jgi:hypothetical protein